MNRRNFIKTTGLSIASIAISDFITGSGTTPDGTFIHFPAKVTALINEQLVVFESKDKQVWTYKSAIVSLKKLQDQSLSADIVAPGVKLSEVSLHWQTPVQTGSAILNDQWERTYGDASWHTPTGNEILPWYFIEYNNGITTGLGVKTGCAAFCYWRINSDTLSLTMDTRSGGSGVQLGNRKCKAAEIVTIKNKAAESAFQTARRFMKAMCSKARMPKQPVYGINDWYFSYGNTSEKLIIQHTELMTPLADGLHNRPFSMIDAGWFKGPPLTPHDCCWGDDMENPNEKFGDMKTLAEKIKKIGMRPGIWTRPLCASYKDKKTLTLPTIKGREPDRPVLDPSIPEVLERVKHYFNRYQQWGYEMVKFDFTSFDILGKWGFEMIQDASMSANNWSMYDSSRTNAEIILNLYKAIREAAGPTYIIGCNTISHLSAGLFELNRIGDDTSGKEWARTKKMGVNTLAFRGVHHGTFYAADSDCVGLTNEVPWEKNKQWMELVAQSGTPLFISAHPDAAGPLQKASIKTCFQYASQNLVVGEPLDWLQSPFPKKWKLNGQLVDFDWD